MTNARCTTAKVPWRGESESGESESESESERRHLPNPPPQVGALSEPRLAKYRARMQEEGWMYVAASRSRRRRVHSNRSASRRKSESPTPYIRLLVYVWARTFCAIPYWVQGHRDSVTMRQCGRRCETARHIGMIGCCTHTTHDAAAHRVSSTFDLKRKMMPVVPGGRGERLQLRDAGMACIMLDLGLS